MAIVQPYLFFSGRCEEALEFYKSAIDAKVDMVMRFNESPEPMPPDMLQTGFEKKVMHSAFRVGDSVIMASDGCDDKAKFGAFQLAIIVETKAECERKFNALVAGGAVNMPLAPTFWSPMYGMVKDKFGMEWMVMVQGEAPPK